MGWVAMRTRARFCLGLALGAWMASGAGNAGAAPDAALEDQAFFIRSWTVEGGTSDNTVVGALRRPDGYLWVAVPAGLFRFDGVRFESFWPPSANVSPGAVTPPMVLDRRGRLWLSRSDGAVVCVGAKAPRVFTSRDGLPALKPVSMVEDAEEGIWLSYGDEFRRIQHGRVQPVAAPTRWGSPGPAWLCGDVSGQVWRARGKRVGVMRAGRYVHRLDTPQPVVLMAAARRGGIWLYDGAQIWRYQEGGKPEPLGVPAPGELKMLYEDRFDRLWAVPVSDVPVSRLYCHYGSGFKLVPVSLAGIESLSDDCEGNLWVGTRGSGLVQVRLRTVELINPKADVPLVAVHSFCEGAGGVRFAVGPAGLLARWRGSGWERMTAQLGWPGGAATCVAEDPGGSVWIGTLASGVFEWKDGQFLAAAGTDALARQNIRSLFPDSNGAVWIGPEGLRGLYRLREGRLQAFAAPPGEGPVCAMEEDAEGDLWAAMADGVLLRVSRDELMDETAGTASPPAPIQCLHAAQDGSLWIGYASRGVGRVKDGAFSLFGPQQGLGEDGVGQIVTDGRGWLWCAGDRGIFRLALAEMEAAAAGGRQAVRPVFCGRGEDLPNLRASCRAWPGAVRSRTGELWMPMTTGLAVVHPERSLAQPPPPVVVVERVTVNGQPVAAYDARTPVRGGAQAPVDLHALSKPLRLEPGLRQLGVEFNVVSFTGQENVRFRYRLEGLREEWVDAGSQRAAYFSPVPPGEYRLQVIACSNEGVWSRPGAGLALLVLPHYWQTWWFRLLSSAAAGGFTGGAVWIAARRRLRRKLERQRALDRERSRIARDIHDDLGAGLTRIAMLSQPAGAGSQPGEFPAASQAAIYRTARDLTLAMDEIVWAVNPRHDTLDSLATYMGKFAQDFLGHVGIRCRLDIPLQLPAWPLTAEVRHNVFLAFKETLNNVARHSQATETRVCLALTGTGFLIRVQDNGTGLRQEPEAVRATGGHGLANMRRRMEEIGGQFAILGPPGGGTTVTLIVPSRSRRRACHPNG